MNCLLCDKPAEEEVCIDCLIDLAAQKRRRSVMALAAIWTPTVIYALIVLMNNTLSDGWLFAAIAPAVLIACFLSAFGYQGIVDAYSVRRGVVTESLQRSARRRSVSEAAS